MGWLHSKTGSTTVLYIVPFINKLSTKEDTSEFVKVWEYYTDKGLEN